MAAHPNACIRAHDRNKWEVRQILAWLDVNGRGSYSYSDVSIPMTWRRGNAHVLNYGNRSFLPCQRDYFRLFLPFFIFSRLDRNEIIFSCIAWFLVQWTGNCTIFAEDHSWIWAEWANFIRLMSFLMRFSTNIKWGFQLYHIKWQFCPGHCAIIQLHVSCTPIDHFLPNIAAFNATRWNIFQLNSIWLQFLLRLHPTNAVVQTMPWHNFYHGLLSLIEKTLND